MYGIVFINPQEDFNAAKIYTTRYKREAYQEAYEEIISWYDIIPDFLKLDGSPSQYETAVNAYNKSAQDHNEDYSRTMTMVIINPLSSLR